MYFDSGNSFSSKRIVEFVRQMSDPANNQVKIRIPELSFSSPPLPFGPLPLKSCN